jgi:hypothetical protein
MTRQVNVYGPADVQVSLNPLAGSPTYNDLGTTRDGVAITSDGYFLDVKNDEMGGEAGPPVEIEFMGETAKIRVELTKYDPAIAKTLEDHCQCTTPGVPAVPGTLMFASSTIQTASGGAVGIKIACASVAAGAIVRTYKRCVIHDAVEVNRGTKFSTFVLTFTAYFDGSALWTEAST